MPQLQILCAYTNSCPHENQALMIFTSLVYVILGLFLLIRFKADKFSKVFLLMMAILSGSAVYLHIYFGFWGLVADLLAILLVLIFPIVAKKVSIKTFVKLFSFKFCIVCAVGLLMWIFGDVQHFFIRDYLPFHSLWHLYSSWMIYTYYRKFTWD